MYNEIDLLILEQIINCSYCNSNDIRRIDFSTTIAAIHRFDDCQGHHEHDNNIISASYKCDKGHMFEIQPLNSCWCGWMQKYIK